MTNSVHHPGRPAAPIACDMRSAEDTPGERLEEWRRLFERALVRRERRADAVVLWFRAAAEVRAQLDSLVRREAACCPFLDYRVETVGDEVMWTTTNVVNGDRREAVDLMLDAIHDLPDHAGSDAELLLERLAEHGLHVIGSGADRPAPSRRQPQQSSSHASPAA